MFMDEYSTNLKENGINKNVQRTIALSEEAKLTCLKIAFDLFNTNRYIYVDVEGNRHMPDPNINGLLETYRCVAGIISP